MLKFAIEIKRATGGITYFVGPSIDTAYNKNPFTIHLEEAKLYDSMGHAVTTGQKLMKKDSIITSCRVIEIEIMARPTGGEVVPKDKGVKTDDQSRYYVKHPVSVDPAKVV